MPKLPSHCEHCQHRLAAPDLVPVFSYLWLKGHCRYCQAPVPRRILRVELTSSIMFALLYWNYGLSTEMATMITLLWGNSILYWYIGLM